MWNGLWKLTVMVGVVGVGLYAAYQAQLGMNRPGAVAPSDLSADESDNPSSNLSTDQGPPLATSMEDGSDIFAKTDSEPRSGNPKKSAKKAADYQIDLLDNFGDEQPTIKTAASSKKSQPAIVSAKQTRRSGVDFREDVDEFVDSPADSAVTPKKLPAEPSNDSAKKKSRPLIRQVNASSADESTETTETEVNPFENELPASDAATNNSTANPTETTAAASDEDSSKANPPAAESPNADTQDEPGRARISTDLPADSDVPRSKRAKKGAVKRVEQAVESEPNPFESAPKSKESPPLSVPDSLPAESAPASDSSALEAPVLGSPEPIAEPVQSSPRENRDLNQPSSPRSLPAEISGEDATLLRSTPNRSTPKRDRQRQPDRLPSDSDSDLMRETPSRPREPLLRQSDYDRVTPIDMVGDGVAGDASQRGLQQPRLTIEKVAQQQAVLDQPLVYTIIVKNAGSSDAHNIVIEDRIPKGTELQGTSPQAELTGKQLTWKHALLKPNEEKRISIKVVPKQEGPIGSVARVYFATEATAEIVVNAPQLEFTAKAPSEVRVGQKFEMVFSLKNVGKVDANNIIVRDLVPDQLKHEAGTDIECPIGKMAPQEVREIVLPVVALKTGSVVNKAILTADSGIRKTLDKEIDIIGEVLVLTRSGQNRLYVERPAVFTNNIRNEGNKSAERVNISEVVPAGMEFESASDGGKFDSNLRAVVWTVGPLAPGYDKSVTVKYVPRETGTHGAKITATGNAGSTAAVNGTVEVIGKPELQMETLSATGAVTVGDRITSRFQLNNTGTASASNVQLRVKLPRELKLISVKGGNFQQKDEYVLFEPIAELGPRKKASYELILEPTAEADAQIGLEISADHLTKPGRRIETIQIARDALK